MCRCFFSIQGHTWYKSYTLNGYEALAKRRREKKKKKRQFTRGERWPAFGKWCIAGSAFCRYTDIANGLEEELATHVVEYE